MHRMEPYDRLAADLQEAFAHLLDRGDALDDDTARRVAQLLIDSGDDKCEMSVGANLRTAYRTDVRRDLMMRMPATMTITDVANVLESSERRARAVLAGLEPISSDESEALDEAFSIE